MGIVLAYPLTDDERSKLPGLVGSPGRDRKLHFRCEICGREKYYKIENSIHHIDGNHENDCPENLLVLCHSCHSSIHPRDYLHKPEIIERRTKTRQKLYDRRKQETGFYFTEKTRQALNKSLKGKNLGRIHTFEARKNMSEGQIGKHHSEKTKQKISKTMKMKFAVEKAFQKFKE